MEHRQSVPRFFPRRDQLLQRGLFLRHHGPDAVSVHGADRAPALARRAGRPGRGHALLRPLSGPAAVVVSLDVFSGPARHACGPTSPAKASARWPRKRGKLLANLNPKYPIQVYAYVSENVPENYVQTKLNLLSTLSELKAAAGNKLERRHPHDRSLELRRHPGRTAIRHPAAAGRRTLARSPHARRDFPGRGGHVRAGQSGDSVFRSGLAGRV